jgi:hypothetical protein
MLSRAAGRLDELCFGRTRRSADEQRRSASARYLESCLAASAACGQLCPRSSAVPSDTAGTAPMRGDRHLRLIAERGRMGRQRASGYNWRALVEADVPR